jgi:hypothetical protein
VVAVVDTNCDPTVVDYVIPGNDDALRAIRLFTSKIADSAAEGVQMVGDKAFPKVAPEYVGERARARRRLKSRPEAALGGGIRKATSRWIWRRCWAEDPKAPVSGTEEEVEPDCRRTRPARKGAIFLKTRAWSRDKDPLHAFLMPEASA